MSPSFPGGEASPGPPTPMDPLPSLRVVILAGGVGARFWPASRPDRPKQLLPLGGARPLIVETVERARLLAGADGIRVVTGAALVEPLRRAVPELPAEAFLAEPAPRGTAPALAWAAVEAWREDPGTVLVSLHADHVIHPTESFVELLRGSVEVARQTGTLLAVAVPPDRPDPGYGYLLPGDPLPPVSGGVPARRVARFVEKPDTAAADRFLEEGYLWNSGIFVWRADRFLEELRARSPEIGSHLPLLEGGDVEGFFRAVPSLAVDHAVMERSPEAATVTATFHWDDVGSWEALARGGGPGGGTADPQGNVAVGTVHAVECRDTLSWAEDGPLVLWGMEGVVAVRSGGVTLVFPRERAAELKALVEGLPATLVTGGGR